MNTQQKKKNDEEEGTRKKKYSQTRILLADSQKWKMFVKLEKKFCHP